MGCCERRGGEWRVERGGAGRADLTVHLHTSTVHYFLSHPHPSPAGGFARAQSSAEAFADGGVAVANAAAEAFAAGDGSAAEALAEVR